MKGFRVMRGFVIVASLTLLLSAAPTFAQTPPGFGAFGEPGRE